MKGKEEAIQAAALLEAALPEMTKEELVAGAKALILLVQMDLEAIECISNERDLAEERLSAAVTILGDLVALSPQDTAACLDKAIAEVKSQTHSLS